MEAHEFLARPRNLVAYLISIMLDKLLDPINDVDEPIIIKVAKITSVQPTITVDRR